MATETAPKDAREVFEGLQLSEFGQLVDHRTLLRQRKRDLESQIEDLDEKIVRLLADHDCERVQHGNVRCQIITKENKRLDKERLLMNGVAMRVIEASTVTTYSTYLDVRETK